LCREGFECSVFFLPDCLFDGIEVGPCCLWIGCGGCGWEFEYVVVIILGGALLFCVVVVVGGVGCGNGGWWWKVGGI